MYFLSRRADFNQTVKTAISIKSNYLCNNPKCRDNTIETSNTSNEIIVLGKACHIEAASPHGPRYNPNSTLKYRKSAENAIWLCPKCADLVDKDYKFYTVDMLKGWKRVAECYYNRNSGLRIFAIGNNCGGVGTSSMTAYLAQAFSLITNSNILCISVGAYDFSGEILKDETVLSKFTKTLPETYRTNTNHIFYIDDFEIVNLSNKKKKTLGKSDLNSDLEKIVKEHNIQYVFIDFGNENNDIHMELANYATDFIIPIGDHSFTSRGIDYVRKRYLSYLQTNVCVWPVFSLGLTMSNMSYKRTWYKELRNSINNIIKLPHIQVIEPATIIPKSSHVYTSTNIFNNRKTQHIADAYMMLAKELLTNNR